jgi:hypothetical protein
MIQAQTKYYPFMKRKPQPHQQKVAENGNCQNQSQAPAIKLESRLHKFASSDSHFLAAACFCHTLNGKLRRAGLVRISRLRVFQSGKALRYRFGPTHLRADDIICKRRLTNFVSLTGRAIIITESISLTGRG